MRSFWLLFLSLALVACASDDKPREDADSWPTVHRGEQKPADEEEKVSLVEERPMVNPAPHDAQNLNKEEPAPLQTEGLRPDEWDLGEQSLPTPAEAARADKILAWNNRVQDILAKGSLADKVAVCASVYKETWRLPKRPKGAYVREFAPDPGLIKGSDARLVDELLAGMNKASDAMLVAYGKLEKYVLDASVQDDGKIGRELLKEFDASHMQYLASRKSFLAVVEQKTEEAEDLLLRGHPLRRQIRVAQRIFGQFREISSLLAIGTPAPQLLNACEQNLENLLATAGRPPFAASPAYERLYRQFLKSVQNYLAVLRRAVTEGMHQLQKQELLRAMETSRAAYNEFAAAINKRN